MAFTACIKLKSVKIPNSMDRISDYLFWKCEALTSIIIPSSVTSIGNNAFELCTALESIELPNSILSIGKEAFSYCKGLLSFEIPNSVISIGERAFYQCIKLESIKIPESVTTIGRGAFEDTFNLRSKYFASVESLCKIKFEDRYALPGGALYIDDQLAKDIIIPNSVTSIGDFAFRASGVNSVEIPNSVTMIGDYAFYNCNIRSIKFPNSLISIGNWAFQQNFGLYSIEIPKSVKSIGDGAFYYCSPLKSVRIPDSLTSIASSVFYDCNLGSIVIPASITSIGEKAFYKSRLNSICTLNSNPPKIDSSSFDENIQSGAILYVPKGSVENYQNDSEWGKFMNVKEISIEIDSNNIQDGVKVGDTSLLQVAIEPSGDLEEYLKWSSYDESIATVNKDGIVTASSVGKVAISASCGGASAEAELKCYPNVGDADWNGNITVADAVDITNFVVKKKTAPEDWEEAVWTEFYVAGANANQDEDGNITFADASATARLALEQPMAEMKNRIAPTSFNEFSEALVIGNATANSNGQVSVAINLDNSVDYVALQADFFVPEGMQVEVKAGSRAVNHSLETMRFDNNRIRVVLFNLGGKAFPAGNEPLLEIVGDASIYDVDALSISNILACDSDAKESMLRFKSATTGVEGISYGVVEILKAADGIHISNAEGKMIEIYSIDGKIVKSFIGRDSLEIVNLPAGVYVVKVANKNLKVIL